MTHSMQLTPSPFQMIKEGTKTIELRLFDEKRRKIQTGDIIEFSNTETGEKIGAKVSALYVFDSFESLYILHYEDHFRAVVQEQLKMESDEKIQAWRKQLSQAEKRITELDRLFVKIYEDNAKGKLSDERFSMMSGNYEAEQKKLKTDVIELQMNIEAQEHQNERLEKFIQKAKHYQDLDSLTPDSLRDMVSAIYVGAPDKSSGKRQQKIEIYYDGAGFIPLNLLIQRETA